MGFDSMYLVDAELTESIWGIGICLFIGLLAFVFKADNGIEMTIQPGHRGRTQLDDYLVTFLFFSMALVIFYTDSLKWISLRRNYSETVGITAGKNRNEIKYSYSVNSQEYSASSSKTYWFANSFQKIEELDGKYVVVYDSTHPEVSLIDFNKRLGN